MTSLIEVSFRTLIIYFFLILGLRATGKRQIGQMTPADLVVLLLISNAVQNAMTGENSTLLGGLIAAATLLGANFILSLLRFKNSRVRFFSEGSPTVLVTRGKEVKENLVKEEINLPELEAAVREHGVKSVKDVDLAVLEIDGTISVVPLDKPMIKPRRHLRGIRNRP
jgi:uncharacterized membrane protein YcaP (DUF421 family)